MILAQDLHSILDDEKEHQSHTSPNLSLQETTVVTESAAPERWAGAINEEKPTSRSVGKETQRKRKGRQEISK